MLDHSHIKSSSYVNYIVYMPCKYNKTNKRSMSIHRKKKGREFPVKTKLSLGGNNDVITKLFLPRGSLVSDIPAGDGKLVNLFLRCSPHSPNRGSSSHPCNHKVLAYVEYRAVFGVFQNIDPSPPSPPSECVLPPHQGGGGGGTHTPGGEGVGVNILEDARHWIDLLQNNLSTPSTINLC